MTDSPYPGTRSASRAGIEQTGRVQRLSLVGRSVALEPLERDHAAALTAAAGEDRSTYRWTTVPDGPVAMRRYVDALLDQAAAGTSVPLVQRRLVDGALVGCTRFMSIVRWRGRPEPDEVEIGGTWLAASAQRGPINTEAKLMLLEHAFEVWNVVRVTLATDARNTQSRAAIERLGARLEGVLRSHRASHAVDEAGQPRDTALFAVTADDWPETKRRLIARRDRVWT